MKSLSFSKFTSLFIAVIITIPIFIIFTSLLRIDYTIWEHLRTYVLPELVLNTLKLIFGVSIGTLLIGVPLAYFNAFYDYPGRKFFSFIALLPMSIPAYIMAFVYVALFDVTGIWSLQIREWLGLAGFLPGIRNFHGISLVLSLCFYPYVYLLSKNAFESQGARAVEVSKMMGLGSVKTFLKVILPLSRPWIFSGLILTLMETVGDFGAVSIFNYTTFTTAIYRSWFGLFSLNSAQQLATILVSAIFLLMVLNHFLDKKKHFTTIGRGSAALSRARLAPLPSLLVIIFSCLVSSLAFFIPFMMILKWAISVMQRDLDQRYFSFMFNSIQIASLTVVVLLFFTVMMANAVRKNPGVIATIIKSVSSLGYAVPGTVLAVGVFVFLNMLEKAISPGQQILTGSIAALIIGLVIRFFSVSLSPLSAAFLRISDSHFMVLGMNQNSRPRNFIKAILPMIKPGIFTAALMVFVEVMKEMPITLMTRPFGKETLSIRIFEMTSEGEWERAALPSLFLILVSLIPTIILFIQSEKQHDK